MRIAFFGTGDFSKEILKNILEGYQQVEVVFTVSQPDKPSGRAHHTLPTPIKLLSQEYNITCLQPEKLRGNVEFIDALRSAKLNFIVVVAYGKIMPQEVLDIPKNGSINIHGSILPNYRGASPIQESIKNGDETTGLTIMYMSAGMDEGDILAIEEVKIAPCETSIDIFKKFSALGPPLLVRTLEGILEGTVIGKTQEHQKATYCKKITKEDGRIDFHNEEGSHIYNKYRAYFGWPGVHSFYEGKNIQFTEVEFEANENCLGEGFSLGDVVEYEREGKKLIAILVKGGLLILHKIKLEGKKEMDIYSFINGNKNFLEYNFL